MTMNSMERTLAAITHTEGDRVPLFLLLSLYGAKELQIPIREYFSNPGNVARAQRRMQAKYRNDVLYTFSYAPVEIEAWGGEVVFVDDGPPNSGEPFLRSIEDIEKLEVPEIADCPGLLRVLETTSILKAEVGSETPIVGVAISPFSLPVMQMGFEKYLELMIFHPTEFDRLMRINEEFCVAWANAQLEAGATAICYFDPLASPLMVERERYLATGHLVAKRTIARIKGPTATHLASGIGLPIVDDLIATGTAIIGFSADEDLDRMKAACRNRICLLGNLNALEMRGWSPSRAASEVKNLIAKAGAGGGLLLADNHGEIPFQVPEDVLLAVSDAVREFGGYPLALR